MKIKFYYILLWFLSFLGFAFIILSLISLKEEISLGKNKRLIESKVVNWRISTNPSFKGTGRNSYDIQYIFSPPNNPIQYTRSDATGRKYLWGALPKKVWSETKLTKKIMISYDAKNPWNNKINGESSYPDIFAALFVGILLASICLFIIFAPRLIRN